MTIDDAKQIDIRHLTTEQLSALGVSQLAFVKPVTLNSGVRAFGIFAADGTPMAVAEGEDLAIAAIQQHELAALRVH